MVYGPIAHVYTSIYFFIHGVGIPDASLSSRHLVTVFTGMGKTQKSNPRYSVTPGPAFWPSRPTLCTEPRPGQQGPYASSLASLSRSWHGAAGDRRTVTASDGWRHHDKL